MSMPFVPTRKQAKSLNDLIERLILENIEIRVIRFMRMSVPSIGGNIIEVLCLEDEDRYEILYDGTIN